MVVTLEWTRGSAGWPQLQCPMLLLLVPLTSHGLHQQGLAADTGHPAGHALEAYHALQQRVRGNVRGAGAAGDRGAECTTQCGALTSALGTLLKPEKVGRGLPARKGVARPAAGRVVARAAPEATPVAWRAAVVAMIADSRKGRLVAPRQAFIPHPDGHAEVWHRTAGL